MKMPKFQLFLGFPIKKEFAKTLEEIDEEIRKAFINDGERYLSKISLNGTMYLGRFIGPRCNLQKLHNVEDNIYSLLIKLAPDYPFHKTPLKLFPAQKEN